MRTLIDWIPSYFTGQTIPLCSFFSLLLLAQLCCTAQRNKFRIMKYLRRGTARRRRTRKEGAFSPIAFLSVLLAASNSVVVLLSEAKEGPTANTNNVFNNRNASRDRTFGTFGGTEGCPSGYFPYPDCNLRYCWATMPCRSAGTEQTFMDNVHPNCCSCKSTHTGDFCDQLVPVVTLPPTAAPTAAPTAGPTVAPTAGPTVAPTAGPTTVAPTEAPTAACVDKLCWESGNLCKAAGTETFNPKKVRVKCITGQKTSECCSCKPHYAGVDCERRICHVDYDCRGQGVAVLSRNAYPNCVCRCRLGFGGRACRTLSSTISMSRSSTRSRPSTTLSRFLTLTHSINLTVTTSASMTMTNSLTKTLTHSLSRSLTQSSSASDVSFSRSYSQALSLSQITRSPTPSRSSSPSHHTESATSSEPATRRTPSASSTLSPTTSSTRSINDASPSQTGYSTPSTSLSASAGPSHSQSLNLTISRTSTPSCRDLDDLAPNDTCSVLRPLSPHETTNYDNNTVSPDSILVVGSSGFTNGRVGQRVSAANTAPEALHAESSCTRIAVSYEDWRGRTGALHFITVVIIDFRVPVESHPSPPLVTADGGSNPERSGDVEAVRSHSEVRRLARFNTTHRLTFSSTAEADYYSAVTTEFRYVGPPTLSRRSYAFKATNWARCPIPMPTDFTVVLQSADRLLPPVLADTEVGLRAVVSLSSSLTLSPSLLLQGGVGRALRQMSRCQTNNLDGADGEEDGFAEFSAGGFLNPFGLSVGGGGVGHGLVRGALVMGCLYVVLMMLLLLSASYVRSIYSRHLRLKLRVDLEEGKFSEDGDTKGKDEARPPGDDESEDLPSFRVPQTQAMALSFALPEPGSSSSSSRVSEARPWYAGLPSMVFVAFSFGLDGVLSAGAILGVAGFNASDRVYGWCAVSLSLMYIGYVACVSTVWFPRSHLVAVKLGDEGDTIEQQSSRHPLSTSFVLRSFGGDRFAEFNEDDNPLHGNILSFAAAAPGSRSKRVDGGQPKASNAWQYKGGFRSKFAWKMRSVLGRVSSPSHEWKVISMSSAASIWRSRYEVFIANHSMPWYCAFELFVASAVAILSNVSFSRGNGSDVEALCVGRSVVCTLLLAGQSFVLIRYRLVVWPWQWAIFSCISVLQTVTAALSVANVPLQESRLELVMDVLSLAVTILLSYITVVEIMLLVRACAPHVRRVLASFCSNKWSRMEARQNERKGTPHLDDLMVENFTLVGDETGEVLLAHNELHEAEMGAVGGRSFYGSKASETLTARSATGQSSASAKELSTTDETSIVREILADFRSYEQANNVCACSGSEQRSGVPNKSF